MKNVNFVTNAAIPVQIDYWFDTAGLCLVGEGYNFDHSWKHMNIVKAG